MKKTLKNKPAPFEPIKEPRTIKVRTILLILVWLGTILMGVCGGWALRSHDNVRVNQEAKNLLKLNTESK